MERVLITGAGGFIGQHTVRAALERLDWEIHVVVSGARIYSFSDKVYMHTADLSNEQDCKQLMRDVRPDIIIHLAWEIGTKNYQREVANLVWVENSLRLLRLFFAFDGRRFVFAGTGAEYYQSGGLCSEEPAQPQRTVYGEGKRAFEQLAHSYCSSNRLEFVSARIFSVYGEKDYRKNFSAIASAIQSFNEGEIFICKTPNNVWDFIHVADVSGALIKIAESDYCGIVNVASGKPCLVKDIFGEIARKMECQSLLRFEENEKDGTILVGDSTVLNKIIGYHCRVDLSDGLDRTIAWWSRRKNA